jgi:hypothetical protein
MFLALPMIMLVAASMSFALRSGIFISAISLAFALEIVATVCFLEFSEPFSIPAAFFNRSDAGGVFTTNVNERSS